MAHHARSRVLSYCIALAILCLGCADSRVSTSALGDVQWPDSQSYCGYFEDPSASPVLWIARHQAPDGSWTPKFVPAACRASKCYGHRSSPMSIAAPATQMILSSGDLYMHPETIAAALRGLDWVIRQQSDDGLCATDVGFRAFLEHCEALRALTTGVQMGLGEYVTAALSRGVAYVSRDGRWLRERHNIQSGAEMIYAAAALAEVAASLESVDRGDRSVLLRQCHEWLIEGESGLDRDTSSPEIANVDSGLLVGSTVGALAVARLNVRLLCNQREDPRTTDLIEIVNGLSPESESARSDYYYRFASTAALVRAGADGWRRWSDRAIEMTCIDVHSHLHTSSQPPESRTECGRLMATIAYCRQIVLLWTLR